MKVSDEKPRQFIQKFKELTDLYNSMTEDEKELLICGLEYYEFYLRHPKFVEM